MRVRAAVCTRSKKRNQPAVHYRLEPEAEPAQSTYNLNPEPTGVQPASLSPEASTETPEPVTNLLQTADLSPKPSKRCPRVSELRLQGVFVRVRLLERSLEDVLLS